MTTVKAKHPPYEDGHLGEVIDDMKLAGPPTIRVVKFQDEFYALEGSHRLAAAHYLGLNPKVVIEESAADALPDHHWKKVSKTLPEYDFDHVLKLDLQNFYGKN